MLGFPMRPAGLAGLVCLLSCADPATAVTFTVATTGGVMQQPTSHYYHAIYGAYVGAGTDSGKFLGRVSWFERPEFSNMGFADKDYGWFGMIGTKVTPAKGHGLYAWFGAGRVEGYIRADDTIATASEKERSYSLPGPTAAVEYAVRLGPLDVAINHQTFIGYVDQGQLDAFVAWPFNLFQLNVGYVW